MVVVGLSFQIVYMGGFWKWVWLLFEKSWLRTSARHKGKTYLRSRKVVYRVMFNFSECDCFVLPSFMTKACIFYVVFLALWIQCMAGTLWYAARLSTVANTPAPWFVYGKATGGMVTGTPLVKRVMQAGMWIDEQFVLHSINNGLSLKERRP